MKSTVHLAVTMLFIISAVTVSCNKNTDGTLIAKWHLSSVAEHRHISTIGRDTSRSVNGGANDYVDFRTDGKVYVSADSVLGKDTSSYVISGTQLTITPRNGNNTYYQIQNLTSTTATLYEEVTDTTGYYEQTIFLTR